MTLNPSEQKFFENFRKEQASAPPGQPALTEIPLDLHRQIVESFLNDKQYTGEAAKVSCENRTVPVRDGYQVPIRIYNSDLKQITPVLMVYPSGGYMLNLFEINAIAASRMAYHSGIKVIVVNFRLGPEHPMPGSMYDSYDVTKYVATHAQEFGIDPKKIFIAGLSSGANCTAVISNLARKDKEFSIHYQIIINMWLVDPKMRLPEFKAYEDQDCFGSEEILNYLVTQQRLTKEDLRNPLINPSCEPDLTGLPKTTMLVGEYDCLRSESEIYYQCLVKAGNQVEKILLPGQTHTTMVLRKVLCDGRDPAEVVAEVIRKNI